MSKQNRLNTASTSVAPKMIPSSIVSHAELGIFFAFIFVVLLVFEQDFIFMLSERSLYLNDDIFRADILKYSCGWLSLISRWITQYFKYPIIAVVLVPTLLTTSSAILRVLYRPAGLMRLLLFLPAILTFVTIQNIDYAIFDCFDCSMYIGYPIALLIAVSLLALSRKSWISSLILSTLLIPILGAYAVAALVAISIDLLARGKKRDAMIAICVTVIATLVSTFILSRYFWHQYPSITLLRPLPNLVFLHTSWIGISSVIALALLPLICKYKRCEEDKVGINAVILSAVALIAICALTRISCYTNTNFYIEMSMQRSLAHQDWDAMLAAAKKAERPTPAIFAYRLIPLMIKDQAVTKTFDFPVYWDYFATSHFAIQHIMFYPDIAMYLGLYNVSLFYSMESLQLSGTTAHLLKVMAMDALLSNEPETASKYISKLSTGPAYKEWCDTWMKYVHDREALIKEQPQMELAAAMGDPNEHLFTSNTLANAIIDKQNIRNPNTIMLRLFTSLYMCKLDRLALDVKATSQYLNSIKIPTYLQEGIVLAIEAGHKDLLNYVILDPEIVIKTRKVVNTARGISSREQARKALNYCRGSYAHYFIFKETNKSVYSGRNVKQ